MTYKFIVVLGFQGVKKKMRNSENFVIYLSHLEDKMWEPPIFHRLTLNGSHHFPR